MTKPIVMKDNIRNIVGYLIGFLAFIVFVPYGLYELSESEWLNNVLIFKSDIVRIITASVLFIPGAVFGAWSNLFLNKVGKGGPVEAFGVEISPKSKKLVTSGPYSLTRNPMVLGSFLMYLSEGVFLNSVSVIICVVAFLFAMILLLKFSEEKRLQRDFGQEYNEYKSRVPMIFPFLFFCKCKK